MKIKSLTIYCSASDNLKQEMYVMAKETAEIISNYNNFSFSNFSSNRILVFGARKISSLPFRVK